MLPRPSQNTMTSEEAAAKVEAETRRREDEVKGKEDELKKMAEDLEKRQEEFQKKMDDEQKKVVQEATKAAAAKAKKTAKENAEMQKFETKMVGDELKFVCDKCDHTANTNRAVKGHWNKKHRREAKEEEDASNHGKVVDDVESKKLKVDKDKLKSNWRDRFDANGDPLDESAMEISFDESVAEIDSRYSGHLYKHT